MSASSESSCSESCSQNNTSSGSASLSSPTPSDLTFTESSLDIDEFLGPPPQEPSVIRTYKIVGDNIDKNIQPRDMRYEHQTRLLHYFHSYMQFVIASILTWMTVKNFSVHFFVLSKVIYIVLNGSSPFVAYKNTIISTKASVKNYGQSTLI